MQKVKNDLNLYIYLNHNWQRITLYSACVAVRVVLPLAEGRVAVGSWGKYCVVASTAGFVHDQDL